MRSTGDPELLSHHSVFVYPFWLVLGVPLFALLLTTLSALFPSRRAARIDPIQALRAE